MLKQAAVTADTASRILLTDTHAGQLSATLFFLFVWENLQRQTNLEVVNGEVRPCASCDKEEQEEAAVCMHVGEVGKVAACVTLLWLHTEGTLRQHGMR